MSGQSVLAIDGLTKMAETKASGFLKGLADGGDVECLSRPLAGTPAWATDDSADPGAAVRPSQPRRTRAR